MAADAESMTADTRPGPGGADLDAFLVPTWFVDCDHPAVAEHAAAVVAGTTTDTERAVRLFYAVRDEVRYDPYLIGDDPSTYRASAVLARRRAYCIPKAVLLTALARAVGLPARLGFADVRNHLASPKLLALLGTDVFAFHGFVELWLSGRWVKATPAFNIELCERFGVRPLEFDGIHDSLFHQFSMDGHRHMEYVRDRGSFADLPLGSILQTFADLYGPSYVTAASGHGPDDLFDDSTLPSPSAT